METSTTTFGLGVRYTGHPDLTRPGFSTGVLRALAKELEAAAEWERVATRWGYGADEEGHGVFQGDER
jgi:hypothetical protein